MFGISIYCWEINFMRKDKTENWRENFNKFQFQLWFKV